MKFNDIIRATLIGGLFGALFIPFIIADSQLFPFITGKGFTFRILTEILFGLWIVGMLFDARIRPRFSWITGSVFLFGSVVLLADLAGMNFFKSFWSNFERMDGFITTLHLVGYFLVMSSVLTSRVNWRYFFNTSIVASVIMSFYVFLQLAGKININQGGVRVDGTFGNATYLAVYMLFNIFIGLLLMVWAYRNSDSGRWFKISTYGVAIVFQAICLYFTATRGAILGLIGGLVVTALCIAVFEKSQPVLRKGSVAALVALLVLVGAFFAARNTEFVRQSPTLGRFASISVQELSNQGRRYVWPMALEGFKEKPILGWGQENFDFVFNKNYDPRMYAQEPWFDRAHNIVLDWLVAGGLLGFLSYLSMFAAFFVVLWKLKTLSLSEKAIIGGLMAAYFFQNLFVFDNLISYMYFFALLAFVHSEFVQGKNEPVWLKRWIEEMPIVQKVLPIVVFIVVIFAVYSANVRPMLASRNIIKALYFESITPEQSLEYFKKAFSYNTFASKEASEQVFNNSGQFLRPTVADATRQEYSMFAVSVLDQQIERMPGDARLMLIMGSLRNRIGDFDGALQYLARAKEAAPRKQTIFLETGLAYLSKGDNAKALESFKAAYDLEPNFTEARTLYAIGAIYSKKNLLAKELIAGITDPNFFDERIISAYAANNQMLEAVRMIEDQTKRNPQSPELRFRLAAGYLEMGHRTKSVEILRVIITDFPQHKAQAEYYIKEIQAGRNP